MTHETQFQAFMRRRIAEHTPIGTAVLEWNAANPREQAEDPLLTISVISADSAMRSRVAAAYAKEQAGAASAGAENWAFSNAYWWASAPGWAAAWNYAVLSGNETPGDDPAVITDGMILAQVQLMLTPPEPPPVVNPNESWTEQAILRWLKARGVEADNPNLSNEELLDLVRDVLDTP